MLKTILISIFALIAVTSHADEKVSQFPVGTASAANSCDAVLYHDCVSNSEKLMNFYDFINLPNAPHGGGRTVNTVSSNFVIPTPLTRDYILNVNTTGSSITITFPDATGSANLCLDVKNIGSNQVNEAALGSQQIEFASTDQIRKYRDSKHYCAVGGNWFSY